MNHIVQKLVFLVAAALPISGRAMADSYSCAVGPVKGSFASDETSRGNDESFATVPGSSVTFTQGGNKPSCVLVRFSAQASSVDINVMQVRAVIDEPKTFGSPGTVDFIGATDTSSPMTGAHSFEFVFPKVSPGKHVVHIQFRTLRGGVVSLFARNTVVQYAQ